MQSVIVKNLSIRKKSGEALLRSLSFSVDSGRILVLSGKSESGKTICAHALCDLLPEELQVEGRLVCKDAVYVGGDPDSQIATLSVEDEVASALEFSCVPAEEVRSRVRRAVRLLGLEGLENRNPWTLSGGQRQRLVLACAIARQSPVLVLDEPCANIDQAGRELVYRLLRARADQGLAVVLFEKRQELPSWADSLAFLPAPSGRPIVGPVLSTPVESALKNISAPTIELNELSLGRKAKRLAGLNLRLAPGSIYVLVGPNGCGKTSLMSVLAGAVSPSSGSLTVDGRAVRRLPDGLVAWAQQNPERQFSRGTVGEEIEFALKNSDIRGPLTRAQLEELPLALDLADAASESPYALSAGKKRRLGVLLALLSNRPLICLDEPTANLDEVGAINRILGAYARKGATIVLSSHDASLLSADQVIRMRAGRIEASPDGPCEAGGQADAFAGPSRPAAAAAAAAVAVPSKQSSPPLNPVAVVGFVFWLTALGAFSKNSALVFSMSAACLIAAAAWHRSWASLARHVAITLLAGAAFALIALRSNWQGLRDVPWAAVAHHGALGSILLAASICAGTFVGVSQLADAVSQRLRVPYLWCSTAVSGTAIVSFLQNAEVLISSAARLGRVRRGAIAHNVMVRALLPAYSALPLFIESIRHAGRLHVTLVSRDFGRYPVKTYRFRYPWRLRDGGAAAALVLLTAVIVVSENWS